MGKEGGKDKGKGELLGTVVKIPVKLPGSIEGNYRIHALRYTQTEIDINTHCTCLDT